MTDYDWIIGQNLRRIRNSHRLRINTVAADLDVSVPTVSRWERGRHQFRVKDLFMVAQYWGVTIVSLFVTDEFNPELNMFLVEPRSPGWRT